jgi:hypothetical protein
VRLPFLLAGTVAVAAGCAPRPTHAQFETAIGAFFLGGAPHRHIHRGVQPAAGDRVVSVRIESVLDVAPSDSYWEG